MSAIASFYVIDIEKHEGLIQAAEAQSKALKKKQWGIFPPKLPLNPDPFWSYISKNAQELDDYPYSGYLLLDVELLIPNILSSEGEVGNRLSGITKSTFISFSEGGAAKTLSIIDNANISKDEIKSYLNEEGRSDEYPDIITPIEDSVRILKAWLSAIKPAQTGILNIG